LYCLFRAPAILLSSLFFPSSATSEIYTLSLHDALPIYEVLRRKARQGVEVRILYDDLGSIITLPNNFMAQLKNEGIQALAFNPVHRYVSRLYINYRNHQKIVVIDGNIGYTGGTNLADEYANLYPKYGHWKDTAIRLEGEAVWSLTVTFLQMWEAESREKDDYLKY